MAHLEFTRGDTEVHTLRLTGPGGAALDLTGGTLFWTMKASDADNDNAAVAAAYWRSNAASNMSVADPTSGVATLSLLASTTASFAPGGYVYDVQFVSGTGAVRTVDRGNVTVYADVTRRTSP